MGDSTGQVNYTAPEYVVVSILYILLVQEQRTPEPISSSHGLRILSFSFDSQRLWKTWERF